MTTVPNALPGQDDIAREVLPNGITVLARENFLSKAVVISGTLSVGSLYDDPALLGVANMTASTLMRGTQFQDFDTLHEQLEQIAATLAISGGAHTTSFGGKALAEDLTTLLGLLSEALRYPAFPVDQVERYRGEVLTALKIAEQDSRVVASKAFRRHCYPIGHPYGQSGIGEPEMVAQITIDQLRTFHQTYFSPHKMVIAIVGAVKREDAIRAVSAVLGDWTHPASPPVILPPAPPLTEPIRITTPLPGKTQTDLIIGWPGPSRFAPDYIAATIANNILGVFGMMGRLGKTVREEQGLAYSCSSRLGGGYGPNPWQINAGVNPVNVEVAFTSILSEVQRLIETPIEASELADNKANFIGRLPLSLESNEGVCGSILNMENYGLGLDYLRHYATRIDAISADEVSAAARHYLSSTAYASAISGAV